MEIPVKVDKKTKFRWIIEVISGQISPRLIPFCNLRSREKDVLALLYYYNNELNNIPAEYKGTILFSADTKKKICEDLKDKNNPEGLSMDNFYNIVMALKKQNLINTDTNTLTYPIEDISSITFRFIENE